MVLYALVNVCVYIYVKTLLVSEFISLKMA